MFISKLDIDDIVAGFCGFIRDPAGSVLVVVALNISLGRPLNGQTQTSVSGLLGVHHELIDLIGHALDQTLAADFDLAGIANLTLAHEDLEGRVGD